VQLFAVPVRTATPSKSQVEISVREEGCDTPDVTVEATIFIQCLTMYYRSLNEILV
jgi:cobalamin biosynthesis protein CbiD